MTLRVAKISASDPPSTWWPGERDQVICTGLMGHRRMRIIVFSAALALATVQLAAAADNDILFAAKNFSDLGEYVGVSGALSGTDVAYKNNTYAIACIKNRQECLVT